LVNITLEQEPVAADPPPEVPRDDNGEPAPRRARIEEVPANAPVILQHTIGPAIVRTGKPLALIKPNKTRWNTDPDMCARIRLVDIPFRTTALKYNKPFPAYETWLEPYLRVVEPLRLFTIKIQQERVPTLSYCTFRVKNLFMHYSLIMADRESTQWLTQRNMLAYAQELRAQLVDKLAQYNNEIAMLSLFLDPCFKAMNAPRFSGEDRERAKEVFKAQFPLPARPLVRRVLTVNDEVDAPMAGSLRAEVDRWISLQPVLTEDLATPDAQKRGRCLQWWHENKKDWPHVWPVAKKTLPAQGTQCDVERNWSHGKHILEDLRSSMDEETFHMILFLYENRHLWGIGDSVAIFGNQ